MLYVGIDPSINNTGIVVLGTDGELLTAANGKDLCAHVKHQPDIRRYMVQAQGIRDILLDQMFTESRDTVGGIAYEGYSYGSTHKAYSLGEYNGILKCFMYMAHPEPMRIIPPTTNKKFATGHGSANKEAMSKAALEECPELVMAVPKLTDDICDAYFLAKIAWYCDNVNRAAVADRGRKALRTRLEIVKKLQEKERHA